jgi:hypothetical protein
MTTNFGVHPIRVLAAFVVWGLGLQCVLGGCFTPSSIGEVTQPITLGVPDHSHPTVVELLDANYVIECTGTLVTPTIVLTAAHCFAGVRIEHAVMSDGNAQTRALVVSAMHPHPEFDLATLQNDIAVLELSTPISDVTPSVIELSKGPTLDESVLVIGFGRTGPDSALTAKRYRGDANVSAIADRTLRLVGAPAQPCVGDSGGPVFSAIEENAPIIGVTSYGDPQCESFAVASRTDAFADFLEPWVSTDRNVPSCSVGLVRTSCVHAPEPWACVAMLWCLRRWRRSGIHTAC